MLKRQQVPLLIWLVFIGATTCLAQTSTDTVKSTEAVKAEVTVISTQTAIQSQVKVEPPYQAKYYGLMHGLIKRLAALISSQENLKPEDMDKMAKDIEKLETRISGLLNAARLSAIETAEATDLDKRKVAAAKTNLALLRSDLFIYYVDSDGKNPADPAALVPKYLDYVPELELPWHTKTSSTTLVDSSKYDMDMSKAVADTGGWLYFADPKSANYGMLIMDCSHKDRLGTELYKY